MRRSLKFSALLLSFALGCTGPKTAPTPTSLPAVVSARWLVTTQLPADVLLIDVRTAAAYREGHLPGAVNLPWGKTDGDPTGDIRMQAYGELERLFSAIGLDRRRPALVYGDGTLLSAAWVTWVIEASGGVSSMLDGGVPAALAAGGKLTTQIAPIKPRNFVANLRASIIADKSVVRQALGQSLPILIDVRKPVEYQGKSSQGPRSGHIPGAISFDWRRMSTGPKTALVLKDRATLERLFQPLSGSPAIAYCNRGRNAALTQVVGRFVGAQISVYDGAWLEWASDVDLPIQAGAR